MQPSDRTDADARPSKDSTRGAAGVGARSLPALEFTVHNLT